MTRTLIGFAVIVLALVVSGEAFRRAALIEDRLATADEQLTTDGRVAPDVAAALDESTGSVARVPVLGARLDREVRYQRAEAAYWQGDYASLAVQPTPAGGTAENDPALLLVTANAAFRRAVLQNRTAPTLAKALDEVLKAYAAVLQADPASTDAAFDYEYVARLRTALTAGRGAAVPAPRTASMQGEEGEPPMGSKQTDFNVIVPLRPEERQDQMDPGQGATFKRKG